jgi:hypothetical protein
MTSLALRKVKVHLYSLLRDAADLVFELVSLRAHLAFEHAVIIIAFTICAQRKTLHGLLHFLAADHITISTL